MILSTESNKKIDLINKLMDSGAQRKSAREGFGIADKYRHLSQYHATHDLCSRKCTSAQSIVGHDCLVMDEADYNKPIHPKKTQPKCAGCGNTGNAAFNKNIDSGMSCNVCGTVAQEVEFVSLGHEKACNPFEDATTHGDNPSDEKWTDALFKDDVETAKEARHRHQQQHGTTLYTRTIKRRLNVGTAISIVESAAVCDHQQLMCIPKRLEDRNRLVQTELKKVIDKYLTNAHNEVKVHLRKNTWHVLQRGYEHQQKCGRNCEICVLQTPAFMFAVLMARILCEQLSQSVGLENYPLETQIPKSTLINHIKSIQRISIDDVGSNAKKGRHSIMRVLEMKDHNLPCSCSWGRMDDFLVNDNTPQLECIEHSTHLNSNYPQPTNDCIFGIRNAIYVMISCQIITRDIKNISLRALSYPPVTTWAKETNLTSDVCAAILVKAVSSGSENASLNQRVDDFIKKMCARSFSCPKNAIEQSNKLKNLISEDTHISLSNESMNTALI